jgi:hypothetical protein
MMHGRAARLIAVGVLALAGLSLLKPFSASYTDVIGSDFVVTRTASCGTPIVAVFNTDPGLGGGSGSAFGAANAREECRREAGTRVARGLALMLTVGAASLVTIWFVRRGRRRASAARETAAVST